MAKLIVLVSLFLLFDAAQSYPEPVGDPIPAIQGLVSRILGESYIDKFDYEIISSSDGKDVFEIDANSLDKKPVLRGNNGVSLASALNFYLKYWCNCSISWGRDGTGDQLNLPSPLPLPESLKRMVSPNKYRYYQNVCTVSYSMAWWDFARWQREIDWMAMNGLNLILSFTGQEFVWKKFYLSIGLTDAEIKHYFSGAAFLAWQRMGNIHGWGGPLDDGWIIAQSELQKKIAARIRQFGMINVLPGFAGHVPKALKRVFPSANLTRNVEWGHFGAKYSEDYLLEPTDPLFVTLGKKYYELIIAEYGTDHVFNMDTYNEMNPSSTDLDFLAVTNEAIYLTMVSVDPDGIFLMQGWLFHDQGFWNNTRIEAFLSKVPDNRMIILDLNSEVSPVWTYTHSYFGKPFVWCLLHNFGGTRGIYGNLTRIATGPIDAMNTPGSSMIGVGITPEAIEHNPVVYDLMGEMSWRSEKVEDVMLWLDGYATRRYGNWTENVHEAWRLLLEGAYQYHSDGSLKALVDRAPELSMESDLRFNPGNIAEAWRLLVSDTASNKLDPSVGPLRYDIVDFGRQTLTNLYIDLHTMFVTAFLMYNETGVNTADELKLLSSLMADIIIDLDTLLASDPNYLLGNWINDARKTAPTNSSKNVTDNLEFNARNQITMWGTGNHEDYASKEWAGLVGDYYLTRWKMFTSYVLDVVQSGGQYNQTEWDDARVQFEWSWNNEIKPYPTTPQGDTIEIASTLVHKYLYTQDYVTDNYQELLDQDILAPESNIFGGEELNLWSNAIEQIVWFCESHPECVGFNYPNVYLKNATSGVQFSAGSVLYLKKNHVLYP